MTEASSRMFSMWGLIHPPAECQNKSSHYQPCSNDLALIKWTPASALLMHSSTVCVSKYMYVQCVRAVVFGVRITQYITLVYHIPAGICGQGSQRVARMCLMGSDYVFQLLRASCICRNTVRLSGLPSRCDSGKVVREPVTDDQKPPTDCWHPRACVHAPLQTSHALHAAGLILK